MLKIYNLTNKTIRTHSGIVLQPNGVVSIEDYQKKEFNTLEDNRMVLIKFESDTPKIEVEEVKPKSTRRKNRKGDKTYGRN